MIQGRILSCKVRTRSQNQTLGRAVFRERRSPATQSSGGPGLTYRAGRGASSAPWPAARHRKALEWGWAPGGQHGSSGGASAGRQPPRSGQRPPAMSRPAPAPVSAPYVRGCPCCLEQTCSMKPRQVSNSGRSRRVFLPGDPGNPVSTHVTAYPLPTPPTRPDTAQDRGLSH